ncbi:MAG: hypothetical protein ACRC20_03190 [Segniliparus sp.]|uniref:hypothetical protein n=1 Tax=Segniliparus sp. TaxID=2804064 RepID=UPI003F2D8180
MATSQPIASQRQAQEALYHYMQATLQQLPYDVSLDNHRYGGTGGVMQCDDRIDQLNAPIQYYNVFDTRVPPGTDYADFVVKVGEIWKGWGWRVEELEDDDKPNRTGTSPDGYQLDIAVYSGKFASYPPKFGGHTPCFPASLRDDDVPAPRVITSDGLLYDEPSTTPTS